jgi:glycosyltransferase involved in cell wall biosynthesis
MNRYKFTILMPCLNEAETIGNCIKKAQRWISKTGYTCEILIADNGSNDNSAKIAKSMGARVVNIKPKGYGNAIYYGVIEAKGDSIIVADADDSYDFSRLDDFSDKLLEGFDFVLGNRFLGGIEPGAMPFKNRYFGNPILSFIGRFLFNIKLRDFHCGIRGFNKNAFLKMDLRTSGMEFASEMVIKASLTNCRIAEVPAKLAKDGRSRKPHLRPWRDGWRHLRFMLLFSPSWLFLYPGLFAFSLSLPIYISLFISPLKIFNFKFDIYTMFYAQSLIMVSILMVLFGILSRVYSIREGLMKTNKFYELFRASSVLEIGATIGLLIFVVGLKQFYVAVSLWKSLDFSITDYGNNFFRLVSFSTLCVELGAILFLFALIFGFIQLPVRR